MQTGVFQISTQKIRKRQVSLQG